MFDNEKILHSNIYNIIISYLLPRRLFAGISVVYHIISLQKFMTI